MASFNSKSEIKKAIKSLNGQTIDQSDQISLFVKNYKKLLFKIAADMNIDSAEAEEKLGEIPLGAGRIAGVIPFSAMSAILQREDAVAMGELTKELMLPPATTNRLVSWWVDNGLAERWRDPKDKRVIKVRITDTGRKFLEISHEIVVARLKPFFSKLTLEETIIFNLLLGKLTSDMQNVSEDKEPV